VEAPLYGDPKELRMPLESARAAQFKTACALSALTVCGLLLITGRLTSALPTAGVRAWLPALETPATITKPPPLRNRDSFQYTITTTSQTGSSSNTTTVTDDETVTHPVSFGTRMNTYAVTDTYSDDPSYSPESYLGFVSEGSVYAIVNYGFFGSDDAGRSFSYKQVTHTPFDIVAEYPESVGLSWANNFEYQGEELDLFSSCCGLEVLMASRASGAYRLTYSFCGTSTCSRSSDSLKSNGLGRIWSENSSSSSSFTTVAFGLPVASGSSYAIPVTCSGDCTDNGYTPGTVEVPDWYPGGGAPLSPLSNSSDRIAASMKAPKTCDSMAGTTAYDVHEKYYDLNPVQGYYQTRTTDSYDSPTMGLVCSISVTVTRNYNNTTDGALTSLNTTTIVTVLTSEHLHSGRSGTGIAAPHVAGFANRLRIAQRPRRDLFDWDFLNLTRPER